MSNPSEIRTRGNIFNSSLNSGILKERGEKKREFISEGIY